MKRILSIVVATLVVASCSTNVIVKNQSAGTVSVTLDGGSAQTIAPGSNYTFSAVPAGESTPSATVKATGIYITEQSFKTSLSPSSDSTVTITNNLALLNLINLSTVKSIYYVYITPSSVATWGTNLLPGTIAIQSSNLFAVAVGLNDIKVVYSDGWTTYSYSNNFAAASVLTKSASWVTSSFAPTSIDRRPPTFEGPKGL